MKNPKGIQITNLINRIKDSFRNNKLSNWVKEILPLGYPEYMYCDATNEYVSMISIIKEGNIKFMDITLADNKTYAMDMNKYGKIKKIFLLKRINKLFDGQKVFRFKRILEYK